MMENLCNGFMLSGVFEAREQRKKFIWRNGFLCEGRQSYVRIVFYTGSKEEYRLLTRKLPEEIPDAQLYHIGSGGHFHFMNCNMGIITRDGTLGAENVPEYSNRYPQAMIVWVTDDIDRILRAYFAVDFTGNYSEKLENRRIFAYDKQKANILEE